LHRACHKIYHSISVNCIICSYSILKSFHFEFRVEINMVFAYASGFGRFLGNCFISYVCTYGFICYGYAVLFPATVKAMGWARGDASIAQTVRALLAVFMSPVVAYVVIRWGVRKSMLFVGILMSVGLVLIGTVMNDLWMWSLLWGIVVGTSFAFVGPVPLQTVATYWFNRYKGTALGIIFTGSVSGGGVAIPSTPGS